MHTDKPINQLLNDYTWQVSNHPHTGETADLRRELERRLVDGEIAIATLKRPAGQGIADPAAVQELLEACRAVDEWHDLIKQNYPEMYRPFGKLRAAIAKALGTETKADLTQTGETP